MSNKALFLDFDGPLHPSTAIEGIRRPPDADACKERQLFRWAPHLEDALSTLSDEQRADLLIVAHSSWRKIEGLSQGLIRESLGPMLAEMYVGMTRPDLDRWESIQDTCQRFDIEDFLIIDDATAEFPAGLPQLVICNPLKGLSDPLVQSRITEWASSDGHAHQAAEATSLQHSPDRQTA